MWADLLFNFFGGVGVFGSFGFLAFLVLVVGFLDAAATPPLPSSA
jgi:hypothetical protein